MHGDGHRADRRNPRGGYVAATQPIAEFPDGLGGAYDARADLRRPLGREVDRTVVHQTEAHVDVVAVGGDLEQAFGKVRQVKGAQVAPSPSFFLLNRPRSPATSRRGRRTAAGGRAMT